MRYLSLDWIDAVATAAADSAEVAEAAKQTEIGVTQVVTDGPEGTVVYSLQVEDGKFSFSAGPAYPEHVRFEQAWDTAVGVATGPYGEDDLLRAHDLRDATYAELAADQGRQERVAEPRERCRFALGCPCSLE